MQNEKNPTREQEVKALKWAAEIMKTTCEGRGEECNGCPLEKLCMCPPESWDLEEIQ